MLPNSARVTVTTAGTASRLSATSVMVYSVVVKAKSANTGEVYAGRSDVSNAKPPLLAGETLTLGGSGELFDLANTYVDVSVNGEGVDIWYVEVLS